MGALWLETVLVSDVLDGVENTIWAGVLVWAMDDISLSLAANVLQFAFLIGRDTVAGFVTVISEVSRK